MDAEEIAKAGRYRPRPCPECGEIRRNLQGHRRKMHGWSSPTVDERFWAKVDRRGDDECWEWQAHTDRGGYGQFSPERSRQVAAHRWSLASHTGKSIPQGMFVLHSCDNPACVNPAHLRLGDHADNMRDRKERGRSASSKAMNCPQGHAYDDANTYRDSAGTRHCRTCHRERARRKRAAQTAQNGATEPATGQTAPGGTDGLNGREMGGER